MNTEISPTMTAASYVAADANEFAARDAATKLRNLLRRNSRFSIVTGTVGLVAGAWSANLLGTDEVAVVRVIAGALLLFAAFVFTVAGGGINTLYQRSGLISLGDFGWVVGTIPAVAMGWFSTRGAVILIAIALVVLGFGLAQVRSRRHLADALAKSDPRFGGER